MHIYGHQYTSADEKSETGAFKGEINSLEIILLIAMQTIQL